MSTLTEKIEHDINMYFDRHNTIVDSNMRDREILVSKMMGLVNEVNISMDDRAEVIEAKLNILKQADGILKSKENLSNAHIKLLLQNKGMEDTNENVERVVDVLKHIKLNQPNNDFLDSNVDKLLDDTFKELKLEINEDELKPIE